VPRRQIALRALPASVLLLAAACTGQTAADAGTSSPSAAVSTSPIASTSPASVLRIAVIEDLSVEDTIGRVTPAFQGVRLAISRAAVAEDLPIPVQLVAHDIEPGGSTLEEIAQDVAADPAVVGAIVMPFTEEPDVIGRAFDQAGIPTLSLSTLGTALSEQGWTTWRRAVANQAEQAAALASFVGSLKSSSRGVCVVGDRSVAANGITVRVARALGDLVGLESSTAADGTGAAALAQRISEAGCGVVVWGGYSTAAVQLRLALDVAGLSDVVLVGSDALKDDDYVDAAGQAGEGTIVSCPCADLNTSGSINAQRFVQDFQTKYGTPPRVYAAEGVDVGRMFLAALRSGARTREEVATYFGRLGEFDGLAGTYVFESNGELSGTSAAVRFYRDEGGRWVQLQGP